MLTYNLLNLLIISNIFLDYIKKIENYKLFLFYILIIVLAVFAGFRTNTPDTNNYINKYLSISTELKDSYKESISNNHELGYILYMKIYKNLGLSYRTFLMCTSLFTLGIFGLFIYRYAIYPFSSLLLLYNFLFLPIFMAQIRASIALSLGLISLYFFLNSKLIKSFVILSIASFFHMSIMVFFFLYCIYYIFKKIRNKTIFFIVMIFLILTLYFLPFDIFFDFILEMFSKNSLVGLKMDFYLKSTYLSGLDNFSLLLFVDIFVLLLIYIKKGQLKNIDNYDFFIIMLLFNIMFNVLSFKIGIIQRLSDLFIISKIIFYPIVFNIYIKNKYLRIIVAYILITYGSLFFNNYLKNDPTFYIDYL
jgi:hypothetical protein